MSPHHFIEMDPADSLVALFHPQVVCPLVCSLKWILLILLWPCSTLRVYVLLSFHQLHPADPLVALLCPQGVHFIVCLLKCTLLTLLWSCSTLRVYVPSSFHQNTPC